MLSLGPPSSNLRARTPQKHGGIGSRLIGSPRPLPLLVSTGYPLSSRGKHDRLPREIEASTKLNSERPRTQGATSRGRVPSSSSCWSHASIYSSSLDLRAWVDRGVELEELSRTLEQPSGLLTAVACDAVSRLTPAPLPQHSVMTRLLSCIEASVYCDQQQQPKILRAEKLADCRGQYVRPQTADSVSPGVPARYADRVPYFMLTRRQDDRLLELRHFSAYLAKVMRNCAGLRAIAPKLCAMTWAGISQASLVWLFAFWRLFCYERRRVERKKAELLAKSMVGDCIIPFMHWRMFVVDQKSEAVQQTRHCFVLEKRMLFVEVKDLQDQRMDVRNKLEISLDTTQRLQERLETEVRNHKDLAKRLESANPELVLNTLCSVLNTVFEVALREAQLNRVITHRTLATKELTVLLTNDEESLQKLVMVPGESLLKRWVNYHLMQCKLVATEIFESVARARNDEGSAAPGDPHAKVNEWSARESELFGERCRIVRGLQRITDLDNDMKDSAVLSVVYASLASSSHGSSALNPAALWPLDERDHDARATKLCAALRLLLPTRAAQCLLKPVDITQGNASILSTILSTFFLHGSNLPSSMPEPRFFAHEAIRTVDHSDDSPQSLKAGEQEQEAWATDPKRTSAAASNDDPMKHVLASMEKTASACAYEPLQDMLLLSEGNETAFDLFSMPPANFLIRWVNFQLKRPSDKRITSLMELKGGVVLLELLRKIAGDVLDTLPESRLLALKMKAEASKGEASKGQTDFKKTRSGALGKDLLAGQSSQTRANLSEQQESPHKKNLREQQEQQDQSSIDQLRRDLVINCGARCTSFSILTSEALVEGRADVVAAFLAGLFLCRPCMPIGGESALHKHMDHIEACVHEGSNVQKEERGKDGGRGFAKVCAWLRDKHATTERALESVQAARDFNYALERRIHTFVVDLLSQRARGAPRKLVAEEEIQDPRAQANAFSNERLGELLRQELGLTNGSENTMMVVAVQDSLWKLLPIAREMFAHYALRRTGGADERFEQTAAPRASVLKAAAAKGPPSSMDQTHMLDLPGLMHMYRDCRLRTTKFLPQDIDQIFHEVKVKAQKLANAQHAKKLAAAAELAAQKNELAAPNLSPKKAQHGNRPSMRRSMTATAREPEAESAPVLDEALKMEDFVEVLVLIACRGQRRGPGGLPVQLTRLGEKHLNPHACRHPDDFFSKTTYDIGVRRIILQHDTALRAVFTAYSKLYDREGNLVEAPGDPGASAPAADENKSESEPTTPTSTDGKKSRQVPPVNLLQLSRFEDLLRDAGIKGPVTGTVLKTIVEGVQAAMIQEAENDADIPEGSDNDSDDSHQELSKPSSTVHGSIRASTGSSYATFGSETTHAQRGASKSPFAQDKFSFPEFVDALMAIVLYVNPNPFEKFCTRLDKFIKNNLLKALKDHWMESSEDTGLGSTLRKIFGEKHADLAPQSGGGRSPRLHRTRTLSKSQLRP